MGHSIAQMGELGFTNPRDVFPPDGFLHSFLAQLVFSARLAVDTFLLLSAFLLTLGAMKKLYSLCERQSVNSEGLANTALSNIVPKPLVLPAGHKWIPLFFLNRYLRIVPLYAACLLFWWQIAPLLGSGPFW